MYGILNILNGDGSKDLRFNLSGLTQNRIINVRNQNGTLALLSDVTGGTGGGVGGSTGSVDNAVLRANGTGGTTIQSSSLIVDDTCQIELGTSSIGGVIRNITTVGSQSSIVFQLKAKGTGYVELLSGNGNAGLISSNSGNTPYIFNTLNNIISYPLTIHNATSGATTVAGVGTGIRFMTKTATANNEIGSIIESVTTDVTAASEDFDLVFRTMSGGTAANAKFRITAIGAIGVGIGATNYGTSGQFLKSNGPNLPASWSNTSGGTGGGIGGSTGSVDNSILRADGTDGSTLQSSPTSITDNGDLNLGTSSTTGSSRTIGVESTLASAHLILAPKGSAGQVVIGFNATGVGLYLGRSTDTSTQHNIGVQGTQANISTGLVSKGTGGITLQALSGTIRLFVDGGAGTGGFLLSDDGSTSTLGMNAQNNASNIQGRNMLIKSGDADASSNLKAGDLFFDLGAKAGTGTTGNIAFFTQTATTGTFGNGQKVIFFKAATANPTTNPTGGGIFFVKSADNLPYWRTPDGNEHPIVAIGTKDLWVPASGMWPRVSNGCASLAKSEIATSLINIQTLDFDPNSQEYAQWTMVLPRNWNNGTVTATVYWTASSGSGDVVWGISGAAYSNDDILTGTLGSEITVTDTLLSANDVHISSTSSAITLSGTPQDADFLAFQITRVAANGGDTLSSDAKLLGVKITITTDGVNAS
jgi:hypothetical protein